MTERVFLIALSFLGGVAVLGVMGIVWCGIIGKEVPASIAVIVTAAVTGIGAAISHPTKIPPNNGNHTPAPPS